MKPAAPIEITGQVFTPPQYAVKMWALAKNSGRFLEPSCGPGVFLTHVPRPYIAIEKDPALAPPGALVQDFFTYPTKNKFTTIIGNPPYVKYQNILPTTKKLLSSTEFDQRSNLYLYFIKKCCAHLAPGGELIFITPRDFMKLTAARKLNQYLLKNGGFTYFEDLGDTKVFPAATPNVCIWRWEKGAPTSVLTERAGQLSYHAEHQGPQYSLGDYFDIRVGAVSGADKYFTHAEFGNENFVCAQTRTTGRLKRMIYNHYTPYLDKYKQILRQRRIKEFNDSNWWHWGRKYYESPRARIYVNCKTRHPEPFFVSKIKAYDGAMLALIPRNDIVEKELPQWSKILNKVNWAQLGFKCGGRYMFTQRALKNICPEIQPPPKSGQVH